MLDVCQVEALAVTGIELVASVAPTANKSIFFIINPPQNSAFKDFRVWSIPSTGVEPVLATEEGGRVLLPNGRGCAFIVAIFLFNG